MVGQGKAAESQRKTVNAQWQTGKAVDVRSQNFGSDCTSCSDAARSAAIEPSATRNGAQPAVCSPKLDKVGELRL